MKLPSDPTTWDNIARICRNADEYLERYYSDESRKRSQKKYCKGKGHINSNVIVLKFTIHTCMQNN